MGTPDFAVGTLKELIDNQYDVVAVVPQPDKPKGRSKELVFSPVKEEAVKNNIQVLQPERARDEAFVEELRTYNADVVSIPGNYNLGEPDTAQSERIAIVPPFGAADAVKYILIGIAIIGVLGVGIFLIKRKVLTK